MLKKFNKEEDKILFVSQSRLTDDECDQAIGIWRKEGVLNNTKDYVHALDYQEELIWSRTFCGFDANDVSNTRKLKKLTTQIIKRYHEHYELCGVDRVVLYVDGTPYSLICKPDARSGVTKYKRSIGSSATNFKIAEETNRGIGLGENFELDFIGRVEKKYPDLMERIRILRLIEDYARESENNARKLIRDMSPIEQIETKNDGNNY